MSASVEKIESLRHSLREMEREICQSEQIRKSLALECDIGKRQLSTTMDPSSMKEEVLAKWMSDYETDVEQFYLGNYPSGDETVGDVMDEIRERTTGGNAHQEDVDISEVDFDSMMKTLDEDAKSLGLLCGELLAKFFPRRVVVGIEKERIQKELSKSSDVDGGEPKSGDEKIDSAASCDRPKGDEKSVDKKEPSNADSATCQETGTEKPIPETGDFESKEKVDVPDLVEETTYLEFVIVDEHNRPLGGTKSASNATGGNAQGDQKEDQREEKENVRVEVAEVVEVESPVELVAEVVEAVPQSPNSSHTMATADGYDSERSSGSESAGSNRADVWLNVATRMVDQENSIDGGSETAMEQIYDIVTMFIPGVNSETGDNEGASQQ